MFENPGGKMKSFANFLFWLSLLGTIILACALGFVEEEVGYLYSYTETVFHGVPFFTTIIVGSIFSYLECLCLYGFGELIENSGKNLAETNPISALQDIESNLPQL